MNQNGTKVFTASFTGKMYDAETGMYYFNARWYDSEIGRFITEDPARDGIDWYAYCNNNPLRFLDPRGLNTLDDYNYQKRTEDSDKSVEKQREYNHQAREYALLNQGLTDYGNAIHNNEQFFYDFLDKKFDKNNPLNQLDLDRALGYRTTLGSTQSCLLASLYNGYACSINNGLSGAQILDTIFDDGGNFRKAPDGTPYITFEVDKRTESKAPYIRGNQLGNFSWNISSTLGLSQYMQIDKAIRYDSMYDDYALNKYGFCGILKMKNESSKTNSYHFMYVDNYTRIDSLPANRLKPEYTDLTIMLMWLRNR